jgi:hypothetical protein
LASAVAGAASAARTAAAEIHRETRAPAKSVKQAVDRTEIVIFSHFWGWAAVGFRYQSQMTVPRFIVANLVWLCHKRSLIARLIKGCRVDARADCFV